MIEREHEGYECTTGVGRICGLSSGEVGWEWFHKSRITVYRWLLDRSGLGFRIRVSSGFWISSDIVFVNPHVIHFSFVVYETTRPRDHDLGSTRSI